MSFEAGVAWVAFVILSFSQSRLLVLLWDIHSNMHTGFDSINLVIQKKQRAEVINKLSHHHPSQTPPSGVGLN